MQHDQISQDQAISSKSIVKYALLPGLFPRLQRLAGHASRFMFIFTQIFGTVGLIERNHPCLRPENIGHYRFVDIIGLAASNVRFDKKHLPQTIMFFVVMASIAMTICIVFAMIASTMMYAGEAQAQFFGTPVANGYTKEKDWGLNFLFRIFGETSFFGKPATGDLGNIWFTTLLVGMLKHYSLAMLVIAAFMIMYILVITMTEAARSGQPFGTRFDSIWAPIRLALAIGLLLPIASPGYNGAQLIVFQSAVWGSNLATNAWYGGISRMEAEGPKFFAASMGDPGYRFLRDIFLINLCVEGIKNLSEGSLLAKNVVWYSATAFFDTVTYTFGPWNAPDYCGQVEMLKAVQGEKLGKPSGSAKAWPEVVVNAYLDIAGEFLPVDKSDQIRGNGAWHNIVPRFGIARIQPQMQSVVMPVAKWMMGEDHTDDEFTKVVENKTNGAKDDAMKWIRIYWSGLGAMPECNPAGGGACATQLPMFASSTYTSLINDYNKWMVDGLKNDAQYGWTTAGVFYLRMSSAMSAISKVVNNPPRVTRLPANFVKAFATADNPTASESLAKAKCSGWGESIMGFFGLGSDVCEKYRISVKMNNYLQGGSAWFKNSIQSNPPNYQAVGGGNFDRALQMAESDTAVNLDAGYILQPVMDKLYELAQISSGELNPLGVVINWGNTLLGAGFAAYAIGLLGLGSGLTDLGFMIGGVLLLPGFVLAFYVPMLPFLHFTFAVIEWMISILEAVIGMPLWALSLISLEGDGLGKGMDGLKRLFEIVLRPTVIVMSLIVSVIVFSAAVSFLNQALGLYKNASGGNADDAFSSAASGLGMVFVYMFAIYTLATSCFKMIDVIPDKFGRWMGLEGGFGSDIKVGVMSDLGKFIAGGVAFKALSDTSGGVQKSLKEGRKKRAGDRADIVEGKK